MVKIIIRGTLPGLNEMIEAYKHGACEGTRLKRRSETVVMHAARRLGKWRAEHDLSNSGVKPLPSGMGI